MKKSSGADARSHFSSVTHHPVPRMDVVARVVTNSQRSPSWSTKLMFYALSTWWKMVC